MKTRLAENNLITFKTQKTELVMLFEKRNRLR
jgi:hypothetical protein